MIQFTAPISPGSSGGALFDDSGSVIGITTSTLTEGQNINLAVHISEAAALYRSRDGSRTEMEDYKPGRGSWTTATPKPTPIPTPKPSPSPEPTATPKPIATARETTKSYNIISEFAPDLKINDVTIRSNGDVFVEWSGGTGPYTVCYQPIDNIFQEDVLHDRFYCVEAYDINKTSIVMQLLVPDHLYRIDVMDKMKNRAFIVFHYESGDFTDFDGKYALIRQKAKKDGVLSYISTFSCSSLTASVKDETTNSTQYGIDIKIVHGDLNRNYDYKMRLVFELPNGDITVYAFNTSIDSYASSGTSYWDFIDFSPIWKHILNQYNKIPAGIYKFYVCLDNTLLTTRNFTFK